MAGAFTLGVCAPHIPGYETHGCNMAAWWLMRAKTLPIPAIGGFCSNRIESEKVRRNVLQQGAIDKWPRRVLKGTIGKAKEQFLPRAWALFDTPCRHGCIGVET